MPRKSFESSNIYPYHVRARCNNRDWYNLKLSEVWQIYCDCAALASTKSQLNILAFVLMHNHFHMLCWTPDANLDKAMWWFMRESSLRIAQSSGRINKIYGSRYKATIIKRPEYFRAAYKYIYRNPVEANICKLVEQYEWSTHVRTDMPLGAGCAYSFDLASTDERHWINTTSSANNTEAVRKALRKSEFKLARAKNTFAETLDF